MAHKTITKAMIRKYFGPSAKIHGKFFGGFHVTTPTGGDLDITQKKFKIHTGGDDVHQAMTLLADEASGGEITVNGSAEGIVAMLAHAEALDVSVTPELKPGCGCLGLFVTILVFMIVLGIAGRESGAVGFVIAALVASWVWSLMKNSRKRDARRRAQALRYPFPRIHGGPRQATRENASQQGWI
jgi:hypothetical protein